MLGIYISHAHMHISKKLIKSKVLYQGGYCSWLFLKNCLLMFRNWEGVTAIRLCPVLIYSVIYETVVWGFVCLLIYFQAVHCT